MCGKRELNGADSAQGLADAIAIVETAGLSPSLNVERLAQALYSGHVQFVIHAYSYTNREIAAEIKAAYDAIVPRCIACSEPARPNDIYCKQHRLRIEEEDRL